MKKHILLGLIYGLIAAALAVAAAAHAASQFAAVVVGVHGGAPPDRDNGRPNWFLKPADTRAGWCAGDAESMPLTFTFSPPVALDTFGVRVNSESPGVAVKVEGDGKPLTRFGPERNSDGSLKGVSVKGVSVKTIALRLEVPPANAPDACIESIFLTAGVGDKQALLMIEGDVTSYNIRAGVVSLMTPATVAPEDPESITVDPRGRYAYVVDKREHTVSQYAIGATGALSPMTPAAVATRREPASLAVHPSGRYAYVAGLLGAVSQYTIGATGALSPMTPATVETVEGRSIKFIAFHPSGRYAYVSSGEDTLQYTIGANGALSPMTPERVDAGEGGNAKPIAVHPSGRYAYVSTGEDILQYTIGANGALSSMTPEKVETGRGDGALSITVDPSGRYAYVARSGGISQYAIGANGALSLIFEPPARQ